MFQAMYGFPFSIALVSEAFLLGALLSGYFRGNKSPPLYRILRRGCEEHATYRCAIVIRA